MTNIQQIPAGLTDEHAELFALDGEPMALHGGRAKNWREFPPEIISLIDNDLSQNEAAELALELAGYLNREDKLKKYSVCRFGSLDNSPDIKNGQLCQSEYFDCGYRGNCSMEGIVCSSLKVNNRVLTPFETEMIKLLATELTLPAVAEVLKISLTTFEIRKKLLFEKLAVQTRAGMVGVAYKLQILMPCSA